MGTRVAVIGGGLVGLATAYTLQQRRPEWTIVLLEKEPEVMQHQSSHNSGVLHSGIYYAPGSLKALNCIRGKALMERFCQEHGIPIEICGKLIVATEKHEEPLLRRVYERGQQNGVTCQLVPGDRLQEFEPHVAGHLGIWVPGTGIVDYPAVGRKLASLIAAHGGEVRTNARLTSSSHEGAGWTLETTAGAQSVDAVINCAGLYSDVVAKILGAQPQVKIVPFRGEYYELRAEAALMCRNLIYPVPDPAYPFLGVHFTRMIRGGVECGPNAVLAFAREGYHRTSVNLRELSETVRFPAFWKFAAKHWRTGLAEFRRSVSRRLFVASLQKLVPSVTEADLMPAHAGVRAQAMDSSGKLVDDFSIIEGQRCVNVLNAPSPAATSCLSIASTIVDILGRQLGA